MIEAQRNEFPLDRLVMRLATLFVQPDGRYAGLPDVDAWPEARDARNYTGPLPAVAHPPCQLWGAMANVNYARCGGEQADARAEGGERYPDRVSGRTASAGEDGDT